MRKLFRDKNKNWGQEKQDAIFRKMPADKKLLLINHFFKLGQKLQSLNDRPKAKK